MEVPAIANKFYYGNKVRGSVVYTLDGLTVMFKHNPVVNIKLDEKKYSAMTQGSRDYATRYSYKGNESGKYSIDMDINLDELENFFNKETHPDTYESMLKLKETKFVFPISFEYDKKEWWSNSEIQTRVSFKYEQFRWVFFLNVKIVEDYEENEKTVYLETKKFDMFTGKELDVSPRTITSLSDRSDKK